MKMNELIDIFKTKKITVKEFLENAWEEGNFENIPQDIRDILPIIAEINHQDRKEIENMIKYFERKVKTIRKEEEVCK